MSFLNIIKKSSPPPTTAKNTKKINTLRCAGNRSWGDATGSGKKGEEQAPGCLEAMNTVSRCILSKINNQQ